MTVGKLLKFSKLQFSYLRPGTHNTIERLDDALKVFYLKRRDSGLRASYRRRFGGAPPASMFEYWKEPPGMERGLREPQ